MSDVFFDVWQQAGRFESRSSVTTWMLTIARFSSKDKASRQRRMASALLAFCSVTSGVSASSSMVSAISGSSSSRYPGGHREDPSVPCSQAPVGSAAEGGRRPWMAMRTVPSRSARARSSRRASSGSHASADSMRAASAARSRPVTCQGIGARVRTGTRAPARPRPGRAGRDRGRQRGPRRAVDQAARAEPASIGGDRPASASPIRRSQPCGPRSRAARSASMRANRSSRAFIDGAPRPSLTGGWP
jgi:hypothetical protein